MRSVIHILLATFAVALAPKIAATEPTPEWWETRINLTAPSDFSAVNIGQIKNLAVGLYDHLGAAGNRGGIPTFEGVVKNWFELDSYGSFILSPEGERIIRNQAASNFSAVNAGQVKALLDPVYNWLLLHHYIRKKPWSDIGAGSGSDFAMINVGQVKSIFNIDLTADYDMDGVPDMWERANGLNPNNARDAGLFPEGGIGTSQLEGLDSDFDGVVDRLERTNGTDPLDYYNGMPPILTQVGGGGNSGAPSAHLMTPIIIQVKDDQGNHLSHAPVTLRVLVPDAEMSLNPATASINLPIRMKFSKPARQMELRTNGDGYIAVYYRLGSTPGPQLIRVSAGASNVTCSFECDYNLPPLAPANLRIQPLGSNQWKLNWEYPGGDGISSVIERQINNDAWEVIGHLPIEQTEFTDISTPINGKIRYRVSASYEMVY